MIFFGADPYPTYAQMQSVGRVHREDAFLGGAWMLTHYDDVALALRDPRLSARRTGGWLNDIHKHARSELAPLQRIFSRALLFLDAPDHSRLRQALAPAFRPAALQKLSEFVRGQVNAALNALPLHAPFDFMEVIAQPIPAAVIAHLMGLQEVDPEELMQCSQDLADFIGNPSPDLALALKAQRSVANLATVFEREIKQRRRRSTLSGDWVGLMMQAQSTGGIQSTSELLAQCVMLLFAGHETTRHLLGNGMHAVLSQPGAWKQLQSSPELLGSALREMLRYNSPVQFTGRRVAQTHTLHGHVLERGDLVIAFIGAANRDPTIYTDPHRFAMDRRQAPHLSFGAGVHACIGAALTYLEAQAIWTVLLDRWSQPSLAGHQTSANNILYHGWQTLPLQLECKLEIA